MFVGHYAPAFAAKPFLPRVSLAVLFAATTLPDFLWMILVSLGVERVAFAPGITRCNALDMLHSPWSHGLAANLVLAALAGLGALAAYRDRRTALWIGGLVLSHWFLDLLTHRPDLPLLWGDPKVGLGLYDSRPALLAVEGGGYLVAFAWYLSRTRTRRLPWLVLPWLFLLFSLAGFVQTTFFPAPPPANAAQWAGFFAFNLLVLGWLHAIDRTREVRP